MEKVEAPLATFKMATDRLDGAGIDYIVFGGIAVWGYGRRRWTRDIDLLIGEADAKRVLVELGDVGFKTEERDHRWLYKAAMDHAHIDLIFRAKGEVVLTPELLDRRRKIKIDGYTFQVMDPENLVLVKILATKEIRPADWYDAISILRNLEGVFDWHYFAGRAAPHADKVLSFLFFVEAFGAEGGGDRVIPAMIIHRLIDIYLRGQSNSKSWYA